MEELKIWMKLSHSLLKRRTDSIIIVGVGNANFNNMIELDSEFSLLKDNKGNQCIRDIVQFVPFNEYKGGDMLAEAVL